MSYLINFLKEHPDNWEEVITAEPYCIKVKRDPELPDLALFMYDQLYSDFYNPIVKECRGIIVDMKNLKPVCWAFNKFHNYGEGPAEAIDWSTARVQEKVDGSIGKIYYYDDSFRLASNSCIQAKNAELISGYNLERIFLKATGDDSINAFAYRNGLDRHATYIFEIVSPYNQVVIQYAQPAIYFLGARNLLSEKEVDLSDCMDYCAKIPKSYPLSSFDECINAAKALNGYGKVENEGFVVVDANWRRIKIKSPDYVALHHLANGLSRESIVHIVRKNELEEVLTYYPKYELFLQEWKEKYDAYHTDLVYLAAVAETVWSAVGEDQKSFALDPRIKGNNEAFALKKYGFNVEEYLETLTDKKLLKRLEQY